MITERELRLLRIIQELRTHVSDLRGIRHPGQPEAVREAGAGGPAVARGHTIGPGRLHKAGNAESILKHCLRMLGLTARYRAGKLTRGQHRRLLMAIREYGRAWLRHEAEAFIRDLRGVPGRDPSGMGRSVAVAAPDAAGETIRGIRWDAEGEFLHATDTGFLAASRRFFGRAKAFVRETIVAGVMSLLGPAPLTGEELDAAEREAQEQDQFFDRFAAEVAAPPPPAAPPMAPGLVPETPIAPPKPAMTPRQFVARVEKYADSSWQAAQRINRTAAVGQGVHKLERRVLGHPKTSHCEDCPPLAELGWQPLGTLPQIGETECGPLCLCHFEYSTGADAPPSFRAKVTAGPDGMVRIGDHLVTQADYEAIMKQVDAFTPVFGATVTMGGD